MNISVIIPAFNESRRIRSVIESAIPYSNDILVIDDGSTDDTANVAIEAGARVLSQEHSGYIAAIKRGFRTSEGDIMVTMDADGEHCADNIPELTSRIANENVDLVIGKRKRIPRLSERFINLLTNFRVKIADSGSGFRAIKRDLALKLKLQGQCTCGILVLEASYLGAIISEVPITVINTEKPRGIAWHHFRQIFHVIEWLLKLEKKEGLRT
jgi:glycosyltransferase involved in cell wall biosynthesis